MVSGSTAAIGPRSSRKRLPTTYPSFSAISEENPGCDSILATRPIPISADGISSGKLCWLAIDLNASKTITPQTSASSGLPDRRITSINPPLRVVWRFPARAQMSYPICIAALVRQSASAFTPRAVIDGPKSPPTSGRSSAIPSRSGSYEEADQRHCLLSRAANGQAAASPSRRAIKSRRFIRSPRRRGASGAAAVDAERGRAPRGR